MAWAIRAAGGGWTELFGPFVIGSGDGAVQYPADWPARATAGERTAAGVFAVEEAGPRPNGPVDGQVIGGTDRPIRQWLVDPVKLQAWLLDQIDAHAAALRQSIITTVAGQADVYRRKQAEVDKVGTLGGTLAQITAALGLLTPAQQQAAYPLLWIEKEAMGFATLAQAYSYVLTKISAANASLNAIERARRLGKASARAAQTAPAKQAAFDSIAWPASA